MSTIYKNGTYYGKAGDPMPAEDMSEVISPLPSVMSRLPILFDETSEERVVGWYKYADGTKKPVYEKNIKDTTPSTSDTNKNFTILSVEKVISINCIYEQSDNYATSIPDYTSTNDMVLAGYYFNNNTLSIYARNSGNNRLNKPYYLTIRYTKSTDIAQ